MFVCPVRTEKTHDYTGIIRQNKHHAGQSARIILSDLLYFAPRTEKPLAVPKPIDALMQANLPSNNHRDEFVIDSPIDEALAIKNQLRLLGEAQSTVSSHTLERLHARSQRLNEHLLPRLFNVRLPVSSLTRQTVLGTQEMLDLLARTSLNLIPPPQLALKNTNESKITASIYSILQAISCHFLLSKLLSMPATQGMWFLLHQTYLVAQKHHVETLKINESGYDLGTYYAHILTMGAIPTAALTALQWSFTYRFLAQSKTSINLSNTLPLDSSLGIIWIIPEQDYPPAHLSRRQPADSALALYINITPLINELDAQCINLESAPPPAGLLPDDISPRLARITLRELVEHLAEPRKRRFPRRRQSYRATLCIGLDALWAQSEQFLPKNEANNLSEWMVVNESPDGYAAMHISGRAQKVQTGDLVGMLRKDETFWNVCIVRWALSENSEHLELGLQMIASHPKAGKMSTPSAGSSYQYPVLMLPAAPPLRCEMAIACQPANRPAPEQTHLLTLTDKKENVCEFVTGASIEQSPTVDICLIHHVAI